MTKTRQVFGDAFLVADADYLRKSERRGTDEALSLSSRTTGQYGLSFVSGTVGGWIVSAALAVAMVAIPWGVQASGVAQSQPEAAVSVADVRASAPLVGDPRHVQDALDEFRQVVREIQALREPEQSGELLALAEAACASSKDASSETAEEWARRLASDLIDSDK